MKRFLAITVLALAAAAVSASNTAKPAYECSLTGKKIAACCCTPAKDGKLYCTLAKKTISSCCCKQISAK